MPPEVQEVDMSWNDQPGDTRWAVWGTEWCCFTVACSHRGLTSGVKDW